MTAYTPISWKFSGRPTTRRSFWPSLSSQNDMERLLSNFFGSELEQGSEGVTHSTFAPAMNVSETKEEYLVTAEVPGMTEKELDISINDGVLTVSGEKKEEFDHTEGKIHHRGRRSGYISQQLYLESSINEDKVDASVKNGVLTIRLPKASGPHDKAKKISVRSA